ncbi:MAG: hypothetical protein Q9171_005145 [Xanthocarpia ochracea]
MSFRFNVDLSLNFPPPPPRSPTQISSSPDQNRDGRPQEMKRGFTGWLQTARRHPRYSLRLLYFITTLAGLIIDNVVLSRLGYYYYDIVDVHRSALGPLIIGLLWQLIIGLLWQLIILYDKRLFRGREVPNWAIAIVETLGFMGFLGLFVGNSIVTGDPHHDTSLGRVDLLMLCYDSAVWAILCLVNGILAVQCYAQGWRNVRPKRAMCSDCERVQGKGKGHAADDEEALLEGDEAEEEEGGEAGPSGQVEPAQYRDEEDRDENA